MTQTKWICLSVSALAIAVFLTVSPLQLGSQQDASIRIDADDIGGVVTSAHGPEAGVWVIAETTDLPTKLSETMNFAAILPPGCNAYAALRTG